MLKLRRGTVLAAGPADGLEQELTVQLQDGTRRSALGDVRLLGPSEVGDELILNVQALDLRLGSGGFDVVHANLTRGLNGEGLKGAHVMKLNYTSLQHAVAPVEEAGAQHGRERALGEPWREKGQMGQLRLPLGVPVAILALHGQLAPLAWEFAQAEPGFRLGFLQTPGGALSGGHSRVVRELRARGLLAGHITVGACYGGEQEAMTTAGALNHGVRTLGWDAVVCGPGPGIVGCGSALGHGGMQALDSAHTALALGARVLLVPRMSCADPRLRHYGISHHTATVLELLLQRVFVAQPKDPGFDGKLPNGWQRHIWGSVPVDISGYAKSGLPAETMGRTLHEDPLFFAASLSGGAFLAGLLVERES